MMTILVLILAVWAFGWAGVGLVFGLLLGGWKWALIGFIIGACINGHPTRK